MTTARLMLTDGVDWSKLKVVNAGDVEIGHVIGFGVADDGRPYAELELTPAALGVGYEKPGEEEDAFG